MSRLSVGCERSSANAKRTLFLQDLFRPSSRVRAFFICCLDVLMQDCLCRQQGGGPEVECPLDREKLAKSEVTLRVLLIYSLGNQFPNACKHCTKYPY